MRFEGWGHDVRDAWRSILRRPGFALLIILTLAIGIGVNSAVFALIDAVLLRPLPYTRPERLVFIWQTLPEHGVLELETTPADYAAWHDEHSFASLALIAAGTFTLTGDAEPERVRGARATASLMPLLGVAPRIGRAFSPDEDAADAAPVAILSDGLWRRRYGADPAVVGRSVNVDGRPHTVIGVMPPAATLPGPLAGSDDLWLPARMTNGERTNTISHNYTAVARLADHVSTAEADAEMHTWAANAARADPSAHAHIGARVVSIAEDAARPIRPALLVLMAGVALLLLVAAANVSTLLLVRASGRQRDLAVRAALGASRGRLVSLAITESVMLATLGALAGLALGEWVLGGLLPLFAESLRRADTIRMSGRVAIAAGLVAVVLGVVFGLLVALRRPATGGNGLGSGGRASAEPGVARARAVLVVVQVAVAVMLLAAAGLMLRSVVRLQQVQAGFTVDHLLTFRLALPPDAYAAAPARRAFVRDLIDRLESAPGVTAAAVNSRLPFGGSRGANGIEIEGRPAAANEQLIADQREVSPTYFASLKIPLLHGRVFMARDDGAAEPVAIINQTMARQFFPDGEAIDRRIRVTAGSTAAVAWSRIVGIVGDVHHTDLSRPPVPEMYRPYAQTPSFDFSVVMRTPGDPSAVAPAVRALVRQIDRALPVYDVRTMDQRIAGSVADRRATALLLLVTAVLAAALAGIAIYGSIWYAVTQRIPEIGIRLALGATSGSICREIVLRAVALTMMGAAIGVTASLAAGPMLRGLLFDTTTADPATYAAVLGAVLVLTMIASIPPARRAMHVDPAIALRWD